MPAGHYARQWLERIDLWPHVASKVVPTSSVRAALAAVEAGNADAAVVYRTDAVGRSRVRVELPRPPGSRAADLVPGGIVTASGQPVKARALLSWLRGATAMGIFKAAGFGAPAVVAR